MIGEHPEVQERLQQEIEDVIGESGNNLGLRFDLVWLGAQDLLGSRYLCAPAQHSPLVGHDSNHNNNNENDNNNDNDNDHNHDDDVVYDDADYDDVDYKDDFKQRSY